MKEKINKSPGLICTISGLVSFILLSAILYFVLFFNNSPVVLQTFVKHTLQKKYEQTFSVTDYQKYDSCIDFVVKNKEKKERKFSVRLYYPTEKNLADENINKTTETVRYLWKKFLFADTYSTIQIEQKIQSDILSILLKDSPEPKQSCSAYAKVTMPKGLPNREEFEKGFSYCISNQKFGTQVQIYVYTKNDINKKTEKELRDYVKKISPATAYIYIIKDDFYIKEVFDVTFADKYVKFPSILLEDDFFVNSIDFIKYSKEKGFQERIQIRSQRIKN